MNSIRRLPEKERRKVRRNYKQKYNKYKKGKNFGRRKDEETVEEAGDWY